MAETFGDALRRLRTAAGLSQSKLARRVPVHTSNISRYESGQQHPDDLRGADGELADRWAPLDTGTLNADQRDRIAYSVRFPGRIDDAAIQALSESLTAQRRLDDILGPDPLIPTSLTQAEMVTRLLKEVNGPHRQQLASVASE